MRLQNTLPFWAFVDAPSIYAYAYAGRYHVSHACRVFAHSTGAVLPRAHTVSGVVHAHLFA